MFIQILLHSTLYCFQCRTFTSNISTSSTRNTAMVKELKILLFYLVLQLLPPSGDLLMPEIFTVTMTQLPWQQIWGVIYNYTKEQFHSLVYILWLIHLNFTFCNVTSPNHQACMSSSVIQWQQAKASPTTPPPPYLPAVVFVAVLVPLLLQVAVGDGF